MRASLASAPIHKTYYSSLMIAAQRATASAAATHLTIEFSCASRRWRAENTLTHCLLVLRVHGRAPSAECKAQSGVHETPAPHIQTHTKSVHAVAAPQHRDHRRIIKSTNTQTRETGNWSRNMVAFIRRDERARAQCRGGGGGSINFYSPRRDATLCHTRSRQSLYLCAAIRFVQYTHRAQAHVFLLFSFFFVFVIDNKLC